MFLTTTTSTMALNNSPLFFSMFPADCRACITWSTLMIANFDAVDFSSSAALFSVRLCICLSRIAPLSLYSLVSISPFRFLRRSSNISICSRSMSSIVLVSSSLTSSSIDESMLSLLGRHLDLYRLFKF